MKSASGGVSFRISLRDYQEIERNLENLGRKGELALRRIQDAAGGRSGGSSIDTMTAALGALDREFEQLQRQVDPTYAALKRFETQQDLVNRAVMTGGVTQQRATQLMSLMRVEYDRVALAGGRSGGTLQSQETHYRRFGAIAQQAGYQVGDFAVQVASGQNAVVALTQQASQLLGFFGPIGAVIGAAAAVLGGLYLAFRDTGAAAEDAAPKVRTLGSALDAAKTITEDAVSAGRALADQQHGEARRVQELARYYRSLGNEMRTIERIRLEGLLSDLRARAGDIRKQADTITEEIENLVNRNLMEERADQFFVGGLARADVGGLQDRVPAYIREVSKALDELRAAGSERIGDGIVTLANRLNELAKEGGPAAEELQKTARALTNPALRAMDVQEQIKALELSLRILSGERPAAALGQVGRAAADLTQRLTDLQARYAVVTEGSSRQLAVLDRETKARELAERAARQHAGELGKTNLSQAELAELTAKFLPQAQRLVDLEWKTAEALRKRGEAHNYAAEQAAIDDKTRTEAHKRAQAMIKERDDLVKSTTREIGETRALTEALKLGDRQYRIVQQTQALLRRDTLLTAEAARKLATELVDSQAELERTRAAGEVLPDALARGFDRVGEAITQAAAQGKRELLDLGNIGRAVMSELLQTGFQLAALNPLKNYLFGSNLPTLGNVAGSGAAGAGAGAGAGMGAGAGAAQVLGAAGQLTGGGGALYNSVATSSFGRTIGLSRIVEDGVGGGFTQLSGAGQFLGDGFAASPWGILGSLGANLLGLGGGIGGTIGGIGGSIVGGGLGAAFLGSILGSAGGPVGAIIGSFLGTALGGLIGGGKPSDYTASFQGVLGERPQRTEDQANDQTRGWRDQGQQAWTTILDTMESTLGARLPQLYADFAFGERDGARSWLYGVNEDGSVNRSDQIFSGQFDSSDQQLAATLQEVLKRSEGLSDDVRTVVDGLDFAELGLERAGQLLGFADEFQTAIEVMMSGTLDLSEAIQGQVKSSIDSTLESIRTFKRDADEAGLSTQAAAEGTRSYVEILLGIKKSTVESMTPVEQEFTRLNALLTEIAPLIAEVGIATEDATAAIGRSIERLRTDFVNSVAQRGLGIGGLRVGEVLTSFRADRQTAETLGVTEQVLATLRNLRDSGLRDALAGLDGQGLRNTILYYSTIERNAPIVAAATELLGQMGEAAGYLTAAQTAAFDGQLRAVERYLGELERTNETWRRLSQQLRQARLGLALDGTLSPLDPGERLAEARRQFEDLSRIAQTGSGQEQLDALAQLPDSSRSLLEASRAYYASSEAYYADFRRVQAVLEATEALTGRQASDTAQQLQLARDTLARLDGLISGQDLVVTSLQQANGILQLIAAEIGAAQAAGGAGAGSAGAANDNAYLGAVARNIDSILLTYRSQRDAAGGPTDAMRLARDEQIGAAIAALTLDQKKAVANLLSIANFSLDSADNPYRRIAGFATGGSFRIVGPAGNDNLTLPPMRVTSGEVANISRADVMADMVGELRAIRDSHRRIEAENRALRDEIAALSSIVAVGAQQTVQAVQAGNVLTLDIRNETRRARAMNSR